MKLPTRATRLSALLSGTAVGVGMPLIDEFGNRFGLSTSAQNLTFIAGLVVLFFGPVLLFVAGPEHLNLQSREMIKKTYWISLGQVALRAVLWLMGAGLGFAVLAAARLF